MTVELPILLASHREAEGSILDKDSLCIFCDQPLYMGVDKFGIRSDTMKTELKPENVKKMGMECAMKFAQVFTDSMLKISEIKEKMK